MPGFRNDCSQHYHSIFHYTVWIRGLLQQILILSVETIAGLEKLVRFVFFLLLVIRLLLSEAGGEHGTEVIIERSFCAVNLLSRVRASLRSQPSVCGQTLPHDGHVQHVYVQIFT